MEKKYIVKNFDSQEYYCGKIHGWAKQHYLVEYFDSIKDAKKFISGEKGRFQIELIYIIII